MKNFLSNALIYQKEIIHTNYDADNAKYFSPEQFYGETFDYYCEFEEKYTTFEIEKHGVIKEYAILPDSYFIDDHLNITFKAEAMCKSCKKHYVHFLLNVFSDKPITDLTGAFTTTRTERSDTFHSATNIYAQKVGVYPEVKININKVVNNFLLEENKTFYYKGLKALSNNLGVGALGYFRRIVESELVHIIEEIKRLPNVEKEEIQKLIDEYNKSGKVSAIYKHMYEFLPLTLKSLDYNPLMLLYSQASEGLHSFSEETSLERAFKVKSLLEFVIMKINEEKSTLKEMRDIVKSLRMDQG